MGDEIVQIIEGATTLHLLTAEGKQSLALSAGMMVVVPQNIWHQFEAPEGVCVMTTTPQPTEHLHVDAEEPQSLKATTHDLVSGRRDRASARREPTVLVSASRVPSYVQVEPSLRLSH